MILKRFILFTALLCAGSTFGMEGPGDNLGGLDEDCFDELSREEQDRVLAEIASELNTDQWKLGPEIMQEIKQNAHFMLVGTAGEVDEEFKRQRYVSEPRRKGFELFKLLERLSEEEDKLAIEMYKRKSIELVQNGADLTVELDSTLYGEKRQPLHLALTLAGDHVFCDGEKDEHFCALSEIAAEMIKVGAVDLEAVDNSGDTPLMSACFSGDLKGVNLLLEHGVNVNTQNEKGETALHVAAGNGMKDIIRLLAAKKADPTITDENGRTAREAAEIKDYPETVALLADYEKQWEAAHAEEPAQKRQRLSKEEE